MKARRSKPEVVFEEEEAPYRFVGTRERVVFTRDREDGSRMERETRSDEGGERIPGTTSREFDPQGNPLQ